MRSIRHTLALLMAAVLVLGSIPFSAAAGTDTDGITAPYKAQTSVEDAEAVTEDITENRPEEDKEIRSNEEETGAAADETGDEPQTAAENTDSAEDSGPAAKKDDAQEAPSDAKTEDAAELTEEKPDATRESGAGEEPEAETETADTMAIDETPEDENVLDFTFTADQADLMSYDPLYMAKYINSNYVDISGGVDLARYIYPVTAARGVATYNGKKQTEFEVTEENYIAGSSYEMPVYNLDDDSKYYVAIPNVNKFNSNFKAYDLTVAYNNEQAEIIKGCKYEKGILYIPKKYIDNPTNKYDVPEYCTIAVQLNYAIGEDYNLSKVIPVQVLADADEPLDYKIAVPNIFDMGSLVVDTGIKGKSIDGMSVFLNGQLIPINDGTYTYDSRTGEVRIGALAAVVSNINIVFDSDNNPPDEETEKQFEGAAGSSEDAEEEEAPAEETKTEEKAEESDADDSENASDESAGEKKSVIDKIKDAAEDIKTSVTEPIVYEASAASDNYNSGWRDSYTENVNVSYDNMYYMRDSSGRIVTVDFDTSKMYVGWRGKANVDAHYNIQEGCDLNTYPGYTDSQNYLYGMYYGHAITDSVISGGTIDYGALDAWYTNVWAVETYAVGWDVSNLATGAYVDVNIVEAHHTETGTYFYEQYTMWGWFQRVRTLIEKNCQREEGGTIGNGVGGNNTFAVQWPVSENGVAISCKLKNLKRTLFTAPRNVELEKDSFSRFGDKVYYISYSYDDGSDVIEVDQSDITNLSAYPDYFTDPRSYWYKYSPPTGYTCQVPKIALFRNDSTGKYEFKDNVFYKGTTSVPENLNPSPYTGSGYEPASYSGYTRLAPYQGEESDTEYFSISAPQLQGQYFAAGCTELGSKTGDSYGQIYLVCLELTDDYVVLAFNSVTTQQNMTAVYKLKIASSGYAKVKKVSDRKHYSHEDSYSLSGATYYVYTDPACTVRATDEETDKYAVMITNAGGMSGTCCLEADKTYYAKEVTASTGFDPDTTVYSFTVTSDNDQDNPVIINSTEPAQTGYIQLVKEADDTNVDYLTEAPNNYTLGGAVYYLYTDSSCKTRAKDTDGKDVTLTTVCGKGAKTAVSNAVQVDIGQYWAKEETAPRGFLLNSSASSPVTVTKASTEDKPAVLKDSDTPTVGRMIELRKTDSSGNKGWKKLLGAQYTLSYYDADPAADVAGLTPKRQWVYEVVEKKDEKGESYAGIDFAGDTPVTSKSSAFYKESVSDPAASQYEIAEKGSQARIIPCGIFTIHENKAPPTLSRNSTVYAGNVAQAVSGVTASTNPPSGTDGMRIELGSDLDVVTDEIPQGIVISVEKLNMQSGDSKPYESASDHSESRKALFSTLAGAEYDVYWDDNTSAPEIVGTIITDENGRGSLSKRTKGRKNQIGELLDAGDYLIAEVKAPPGFVTDRYLVSEGKQSARAEGSETVTADYADDDSNTVIRKISGNYSGTNETEVITGYDEDNDPVYGAVSSAYTFKARFLSNDVSSFTYTITSCEPGTEVRIKKTDALTGEAVPGAVLQAVTKDGGIVVEEWTTDNEEHLIRELPAGSYILREAEAPPGYEQADDIEFEITEDKACYTIEMKDMPFKVDHTKDVKQNQHDGPDGEIGTLDYVLKSVNIGAAVHNAVITDRVISKNLSYIEDSFKVMLNDDDITSECHITLNENDFEIRTGKDLGQNDSIVITYSARVKNRKIVYNESVFTADEIDGIMDDEHVPSPEDGSQVTVHKTSDPVSGSVVKEKDTITYILTAANTGRDTSKYTRIRDYIPEGTSYSAVLDGGVYIEKGGYCEWVISGLRPGESKTLRFRVKVNDDPPKEIWNAARYCTTDDDPGRPGEEPKDPGLETEETVHYTADDHETHPLLRAVKSSDPSAGTAVTPGENVVYSIELENYGDAKAENAGIRDYIPENTEFVSAGSGGRYNAEKKCVDWTGLNLASKARIKVTYVVRVLDSAVNAGFIANQALYQNEWTDTAKDPSSSTNIVEHPVTILNLVKSCDPASGSTVKTGRKITYTLTLTNAGKADIRNAGIRDYIPAGTTYISVAPGGVYNMVLNCAEWHNLHIKAGETRQFSFTVKVNDNAPKNIANHALYGSNWDGVKDPANRSNEVLHITEAKVKGAYSSPGTGDRSRILLLLNITLLTAALALAIVLRSRKNTGR